jgi:hypothetical protein
MESDCSLSSTQRIVFLGFIIFTGGKVFLFSFFSEIYLLKSEAEC